MASRRKDRRWTGPVGGTAGPADSGLMAYPADLAIHCLPASISNIKAQLRQSYEQTFLDSVRDAETRGRTALASIDFHEGVMSFVERRAPAFAPFGQGSRRRSE
jgi:enoyl-CoA hydratase/carnithine racemase